MGWLASGLLVMGVVGAVSLGACAGETGTGTSGSDLGFPNVESSDITPTTVNSVFVRADTDAGSLSVSMRYPREAVLIGSAGHSSPMDHVFPIAGVVPRMTGTAAGGFDSLADLWRAGPVSFARKEVGKQRYYVGADSRYGLIVDSSGRLGGRQIATTLTMLLGYEKHLATAAFPVVRMRQWIDGTWYQLRHYGLDSFVFYVAPVDDVRLEIVIVPVIAKYFGHRVMVGAASAELESQVGFTLHEGFQGLPGVLRESLDGRRTGSRSAVEVSFPYWAISATNGQVDIIIDSSPALDHEGIQTLPGSFDLFSTKGTSPTYLPPGVPEFNRFVRRSRELSEILLESPDGPWYPPRDEEFPSWTQGGR